ARTTAANAIWTWHTVNSGFFSRQFLPHPRQKQVTDRTQKQVPLQPHITPTLVVIQPDFAFIVFKTALDPPTRKRYQQQLLYRGVHRFIAHEVLGFLRLSTVSRNQEVIGTVWQALLVFRIDPVPFPPPDEGALDTILPPPALPGLLPHDRTGQEFF